VLNALLNAFKGPLVTGGLVLMVSGALMALLRKTPLQVFAWIRRRMIVEVEVRDLALLEQVGTYLSMHLLTKQAMRARLLQSSGHGPAGPASLPRVILEPGVGLHVIRFEGRRLLLSRVLENEASELRPRIETLMIRYLGRDSGRAQRFLAAAVAEHARQHRGATPIYIQSWNDWLRMDLPASRSLDSVILPGNLAEELREDAELFLSRREWYASLGLPWRRGYLFEGPPGSGKSSAARALSGALELPLYVPDLRDPQLTDRRLALIWSRIPCRAAVLIEDADCIAPDRKDRNGEVGISLAGMLNVIDGPLAGEGRIIILTTNHPERLDPSLIRRGRVDVHVHLGPATEDQAERLYRRLRPEGDGARDFARRGAGRAMVDLQAELVGMQIE
jgi:chaperone BCS1